MESTTTLVTTATSLSSTTTTTTSTTSTASSSTTILDSEGCGDVDSDGVHDSTDALLLRAAVGLDRCPLSYCDVNCSGEVTAVDALSILRAAVGLPVTVLFPES